MSEEIKTLHVPFAKWLRDSGQPFTYSNPSKPTGCSLGNADFICHRSGRDLHIEMKDKDTRISASQRKRHAELSAAGTAVHVCRALDDAIALVVEWRRQIGAPDAPESSSRGPGPLTIRNVPGFGDYVFENEKKLRRATLPIDRFLPRV